MPRKISKTSCGFVLLLLVILHAQDALTEPASDTQMAAEAIAPFMPKDPVKRDELLAWNVRKVIEHAAESPENVRPATVFFRRGISVEELDRLQTRLGIEVMDVVLKAPEGKNGQVMSIMVGMGDMFVIDGSLENRLSFVVSAEQKCFAKAAEAAPGEEQQKFSDLSKTRFLVYSARVFGPNRSLRELMKQSSVAAVILNLRAKIISEYAAAKSYEGPHRYLMPGFAC